MANFIHEIRITELKKKITYNGQNDVICHARWSLTTYREDYPDEKEVFSGATPFTISAADLNVDAFTSFGDVTEAQVISWVEANAINLGDLKFKNEQKLQEKLEPTEVSVASPWDPTIAPPAAPIIDP
ncbi:hypothetical protein [Synechococcus phage DSL-LC03]|nr:hypothetical protein [Synechococcus phage DSL-LC03]